MIQHFVKKSLKVTHNIYELNKTKVMLVQTMYFKHDELVNKINNE